MFSIKNLLKVTMICLCAMLIEVSVSVAQMPDNVRQQLEEMRKSGVFFMTPELQAYYDSRSEKASEIRKWFEEKKKELNVNHPTPEETRLIEEGKKLWDERRQSLDEDEYYDLYDSWDEEESSAYRILFMSLDPNSSSDADVLALISKDYVYKQIDDYASNLGTTYANEPPKPKNTAAPTEETGGVVNGGSTTTEVNTVVNNNGDITTSSGVGSVTPSAETPATSDTSPGTTPAATPTDTPTDGTPTATPATTPTDGSPAVPEATAQKYTGVYKGRQLIPDLMAQHCQITEEKLKEIAEHPDKLEECIVQYLKEMNSKEKNAQAQAIKDYNMLRFATLLDVQTTAIAQTGNVNNYEETMNEYGQATMEADTKFDTEGALTNTQAFSTDVMNGIRTLYAEFLKYAAIDGFATIDKSAFVEEEETPAPATTAKPVTTTGTVDEHAVLATATITTNAAGDSNGTYDPSTQQCTSNGTTGACADGTYKDKDGNLWDCKQGKCVQQNSNTTTPTATPAPAATPAVSTDDPYQQRLTQMTDQELIEEEYRMRALEREYEEVLARRSSSGHGVAISPEQEAKYKDASRKSEMILKERLRRQI